MKSTTIKYILFLSLAFTSISCDKLAAIIPDIHVNVPLDITIDVKATDPSDYSSKFEVSGLNDSISKYKNLIKDYVVDSVTMSLLEVKLPASDRRDSYRFIDFSIINDQATVLIPNIYLFYLTDFGNYYSTKYFESTKTIVIAAGGKAENINLPGQYLTFIGNSLKTTNKLSGTISASTEIKPLTVKIRLTFYATAKTH
ncbi:MAG: hypothetical protein NT104_00785 [Bacteroidetes bacterium]|nr:hypothetical protein [Bacteroidota bacterium]